MGPTQVLVCDPCPLGLPEMLTMAHMSCSQHYLEVFLCAVVSGG